MANSDAAQLRATVVAESAPSQILTGIGIKLLAVGMFSAMDTMAKLMVQRYGVFEIMFFRALFAFVPLGWLVWHSGGLMSLRTSRPWMQALRAVTGVSSLALFIFAFGMMPLADAVALGFTAPLFMTALSVPLLRERVGWRRWTAVAVGLAGVMIMVRPGSAVFGLGAAVCILGAFCYALATCLVRMLSRTDSNAAIVFYSTLGMGVAGIGSVPWWTLPQGADWLILITIGLVGGTAQICLTHAIRLAPMSVIAPFDYTSILWATLFGFLLWGDVPEQMVLVGAAVVASSGLYILHREAVRGRAVATTPKPTAAP